MYIWTQDNVIINFDQYTRVDVRDIMGTRSDKYVVLTFRQKIPLNHIKEHI